MALIPSGLCHAQYFRRKTLKNVRTSEAIPPVFLAVDGFCWRRPDEFAPVTTYNRDTRTVEPFVKHLIGARTDEPLEELLEHTDLEPLSEGG